MSSVRMEFFEADSVSELAVPGVRSRQLLWPRGSQSVRLTITEVHVEPKGTQPRHVHESSEQVWYALQGTATLLAADDTSRPFVAGDVVRFPEGCVHGLDNTGADEFVYLSVTSPPLDFTRAYEGVR